MNHISQSSQKFFLSRKNQSGQVAIFVALIFQVIFVFFALLINVGLLVHHKINLQQSADLAAYYGAMKQAEQLNAISHINFQLRQNWKLLTWRYRILGTFGFQRETVGGPVAQKFPFESEVNWVYNADQNITCTSPPEARNLGIQDVPFFCAGHGGFQGWRNPNDTSCRISCATFKEGKPIKAIPNIAGISTGYGGTGAPAIDNLINQVNSRQEALCEDLSKFGASIMAQFVAAYQNESTNRKKAIEMLASNLSSSAESQVDLDGGKIKDGAERTFENNLTEANLTGKQYFEVANGLSQGDCAYENGDPRNTRREFLKKIEFEFINYFIHHCEVQSAAGGTGQNIYKPQALYGSNNRVSPFFTSRIDAGLVPILESVFNNDQKHIIGFEKNPSCIEYYGIKAISQPKIPFLPIDSIQLHAIAVAKPFGGSIGPRFGKQWPDGDSKSQFNDADANSKLDQMLPYRLPPDPSMVEDIFSAMTQQPNFSLFVGDTLGLRSGRIVAAFHSLLARRDFPSYPSYYDSNENTQGKLSSQGSTWPAFNDYTGIETMTTPLTYDSLAKKRSGVRALELAAIAPNQFDLTYYSIDPDFYNNYYTRIYKNFDVINSASGGKGPASKDYLRPDFGTKIDSGIVSNLMPSPEPPLTDSMFSVKDQILIKNIIFDKQPATTTPHAPAKYSDAFPSFTNFQQSLLTGWTFKNFTNYSDFPDGPLDARTTMSFAKCNDDWNKSGGITTPGLFDSPKSMGAEYPPTPGNCVTGGRTGYSVKIVNPFTLSATPPSGMGTVLNPLPSSFLSF